MFEGEELSRVATEDGSIGHGEIRIGDTVVGDSAFGQRGGRVKDPFGTIWWVVAQVEDVAEEEMWKRLRMPEYVEAMKVAQETFDAEMTGRGSGRSSAPVRTDG